MTATCRSCGSGDLRPFLDLGHMPLSDGLRRADEIGTPQKRYPLVAAFCPDCTLAQITEQVDPHELFSDDYPYFSSFSDSLLRHSEANVAALCHDRKLGQQSFVLEIASNDGYLLQYFKRQGVPVLGIDAAKGPVEAAIARGIPTRHTFFTAELADRLAAQGVAADVIVANNVMAHVPDLNGFVAGMARLLKPDGITSIEAPYVRDLIDHCEFDTIYHEHLCYFSVHAVETLFRRHGLFLNRVVELPIHGGTLRYHASPTADPDGSVARLLDAERSRGMNDFAFYAGFGARVEALRDRLKTLIARLVASGKSIAAYGAAAKGTILLNYVGLDHSVLAFCVDRNVHKQGRYLPGVDVQILPPEELLARRPDYALLLPWNLEREIVGQQRAYLEAGGRFIIPVPVPRIVSLDDVA